MNFQNNSTHCHPQYPLPARKRSSFSSLKRFSVRRVISGQLGSRGWFVTGGCYFAVALYSLFLIPLLILFVPGFAFAQPLSLCGGGQGGLPSLWERAEDGIRYDDGAVQIGETLDANSISIGGNQLEELFVNEGQADSISSSMLQSGSVGQREVNSGEVQRRIVESCSSGQAIRAVSSVGNVTCQNIPDGTVSLDGGRFVVNCPSGGFGCNVTTPRTLEPTSTHICFLTRVNFSNTSIHSAPVFPFTAISGGDCTVDISGGNWILWATHSSGGTASCYARCFTRN